jgi:hypothetical protein
MKKTFVLFTFGNFVQILPESGSALDPDPHSSKVLDPDPYPDPHITNADPKHWVQVPQLLGFDALY